VFAKDWHGFGTTTDSEMGDYNVNDVAPVVSNINFNGGDHVILAIKDHPDTTVLATSTSVTDNNGCIDIVGATSTIYLSSAAGGSNCTANDNNCYKVDSGSCVVSNCVGTIAQVVCTADLKYFAIPTDNSADNPRATENWIAAINVYDQANQTVATNSTQVIDVQSTAALGVDEAAIPYGVFVGNTNSGTTNSTTTVINFGNAPIDLDLDGTDMSRIPSGVIGANYQKYSLANFSYTVGGINLSSTTPANVSTNIARPADGVDTERPVYWGIAVPVGLLSGDYFGVNSFVVKLQPSGGTW
jgi:hypothetical protein